MLRHFENLVTFTLIWSCSYLSISLSRLGYLRLTFLSTYETYIGQSMEVIHISMTRKEGEQFACTSIFVSGNSFPNLCLMYCPTKLVYLLLIIKSTLRCKSYQEKWKSVFLNISALHTSVSCTCVL